MSDEINDLIAEARQEESIQDKLGDGFGEGSEERAFYYEHRDRYKRLADALEAATRQPSENDREAAFESGMEMVDWGMVRDGVGDPQEAAGIAVRAALGARAAVPDAATERFEKAEHDRLYWRRRYQSMHKRAKAAEAERDAAVAALERVRELHPIVRTALNNPICQTCGTPFPCPTVAALDGAPEPEVKP